MLKSEVDSSNISAVAWEDQTLYVIFKKNGIKGAYYDVPVEEYHAMVNASSAGEYLHREIKPKYRYEQISPPKLVAPGPSPSSGKAEAVAQAVD